MSEQRLSVIDSLVDVEADLVHMATQILSASNRGSLHNLFANSAIYAATQSRRVREAIEKGGESEVDLIAWSTRCLYETQLMLVHVMTKEHDDALAIIEGELTRDDLEISIGVREYLGDTSELTKTTAGELPKTPPLSSLAKQANFADEHRSYYKLLCKYTHPSMFLLFGSPAYVRSPEAVDAMIDRAYYYASLVRGAIAYVVDNL